jgi:WD40 repeat protein
MVGCIALSADGSLIASSGTDRRLHLFDRASGEQLLALMGHERGRRVMAVDFSAGGDRVLTLDNAGGLVTWDTRPAASRPQDAPPAQ